jgi:23S rRNA pseudouridine1911/1915/1917 synthase
MSYITFQVQKHHNNLSVRDLLTSFHLAKSKIYRLEQSSSVMINGKFAPFSSILKVKDHILIDLTGFDEDSFLPTFNPIEIIYEDDMMFVVNKPAGMIIYPDDPLKTGTLVNDILGYYHRQGIEGPVRYLHRLDKETTGCFVVAKNFLAHSYLSHLWDHVLIERNYLALVKGQLNPQSGQIEEPIGKDRHLQNRYRVSTTGKPALTLYEVIDHVPNYSLVKFTLMTGRTHQIRVHSAHLGHPVLGDTLYGKGDEPDTPLCLHSYAVTLTHPITHEPVKVTADMPKAFHRYLN